MCLLPKNTKNFRVRSGIVIGRKIMNRQIAHFSCKGPYSLVGKRKMKCRNGKLGKDGEIPKCVKKQ